MHTVAERAYFEEPYGFDFFQAVRCARARCALEGGAGGPGRAGRRPRQGKQLPALANRYPFPPSSLARWRRVGAGLLRRS